MALVDDIATYIESQSTAFSKLSGTSGNVARGIMLDAPNVPDTVLGIYDTAGLPNLFTFSTATGTVNVAFERPGFQILSRSTSYATAESRATTAYELLDGLTHTNLPTSTGTLYHEIVAQQRPFFLQRDENHRVVFSCNFLAMRQR